MMKKFTCIILSLFIAISPCLAFCDFSYADSSEPEWQTVEDDNIMSAAMKAYAVAANRVLTQIAFVNYNDPIGAAFAKWTYSIYKRAAVNSGVDLNELQQSLKYRVNSNGTLEFLYSGSYINLYNKIINQYLIDQGIDPSDFTGEKEVYNGKIYVDTNSNVTYLFSTTSRPRDSSSLTNINWDTLNNYFTETGTYYLYSPEEILSQYSSNLSNFYLADGLDNMQNSAGNMLTQNNNLRVEFSTNSGTSTLSATSSTNFVKKVYYITGTYVSNINQWTEVKATGVPIITYYLNDTTGYPCNICILSQNANDPSLYTLCRISSNLRITNSSIFDAAINIAKIGGDAANMAAGKNAAINIGNYGADAAMAAIQYLNDNQPNEPEVDPDVQDGTPNYPKPTPSTSNIGINQDTNGNFNFTMPDLNLDWELDLDLNNLPFPFSIPHDLYNAFNSLNVQPETPRFQGTIDLVVYDWPVDIDFSDYSSLANVFRKWILFLYIVTLIIATRSVMHIY